ncbi:MAG: 4-hydroxythreonine-4-phosphate dehydrogenase PdxA [Candidatus Fischerbacteria bacterium RBG_13_37_8]|uniref:4-hydroxythreonine-4-phosphate dehydrogenase PdxA n=1 Tax=Candidatus Fischerbacteria bacterium RBG_13_37_8 TaxID=1817863 RepID=A0A1F5VVN9_9BACT|nr:MAG: 4-hydroxythreonine-4-phosphate dehydrogenase PdxA [Candidatus Fischerbacteria bacterium RBG_13_37_8]
MSETIITKNLFITSGDPGGIGAQVIIKALAIFDLPEQWTLWILGDADYYAFLSKKLGIAQFWSTIKKCNKLPLCGSGEKILIDFKNVAEIVLGRTGKNYGRAAGDYLTYAVELYQQGQLHALVTAPISKKSLWSGGYKYAGHTHFLAKETKTNYVTMSMLSKKLKVFFVTDHIAFHSVIKKLTERKIIKTIQRAKDCLEQLEFGRIKIGVCSLNPHAGEEGIFGSEENIISRACYYWKQKGVHISEPLAPEICFRKAIHGDFDGVIAMYHDQGMIPFKLMSGGYGINVTLGLPFVRVSPEHGTAFDIADGADADESSMLNAFYFAVLSKLQK